MPYICFVTQQRFRDTTCGTADEWSRSQLYIKFAESYYRANRAACCVFCAPQTILHFFKMKLKGLCARHLVFILSLVHKKSLIYTYTRTHYWHVVQERTDRELVCFVTVSGYLFEFADVGVLHASAHSETPGLPFEYSGPSWRGIVVARWRCAGSEESAEENIKVVG